MKQALKTIAIAALVMAGLDAQATTKELAEKYLRATQVPQIVESRAKLSH